MVSLAIFDGGQKFSITVFLSVSLDWTIFFLTPLEMWRNLWNDESVMCWKETLDQYTLGPVGLDCFRLLCVMESVTSVRDFKNILWELPVLLYLTFILSWTVDIDQAVKVY